MWIPAQRCFSARQLTKGQHGNCEAAWSVTGKFSHREAHIIVVGAGVGGVDYGSANTTYAPRPEDFCELAPLPGERIPQVFGVVALTTM